MRFFVKNVRVFHEGLSSFIHDSPVSGYFIILFSSVSFYFLFRCFFKSGCTFFCVVRRRVDDDEFILST